jgi:hypothetical protein
MVFFFYSRFSHSCQKCPQELVLNFTFLDVTFSSLDFISLSAIQEERLNEKLMMLNWEPINLYGIRRTDPQPEDL